MRGWREGVWTAGWGLWLAASSVRAGCLELQPETADSLAREFSLTSTQTSWIRDRLREGSLRHPDDLWDCPDAEDDLVAKLGQRLCWGLQLAARAELASSSLRNHREVRLVSGTRRFEGALRMRTRSQETLYRGGGAVNAGAGRIVAGHLRRRLGLGLLVATPGTGPRGHAPVRFASAPWRITSSLDSPRGVSGSWEHSKLFVSAVQMEEEGRIGELHLPGAGVGLALADSDNEQGASFWFHRKRSRSQLGGEFVSRTGRSPSLGVSIRLGGTAWSYRSSWVRDSKTQRTDVRLEGSASLGAHRLRVAWRSWWKGTVDTRYREIEVRRRLARGLNVNVFFRQKTVSRVPDLKVRRIRVEANRRVVRGLLSLEERGTPEGKGVLLLGRGGRRLGALALELRASYWKVTGRDPGGYRYRRRPGALFDLERAYPGVSWGVWGEWRLGFLRVECAADRMERFTELAAALHFSWE